MTYCFFFSLNFLAYHSSSVCNENGELFSFIGSSMIWLDPNLLFYIQFFNLQHFAYWISLLRSYLILRWSVISLLKYILHFRAIHMLFFMKKISFYGSLCNYWLLVIKVKRLCPNDPDATKKLKECEKAVMKLKFEEAISVPESQKRSVADSIDYHTIGTPGTPFLTVMSFIIFATDIIACLLLKINFLNFPLLT